MRDTKRLRTARFYEQMTNLGFTYGETEILRRAQLTLHTWAEHECNGNIQRTEARTLAIHSDEMRDGLRVVAINYRGNPGETVKELPVHITDAKDPQAVAILSKLQQREEESADKPRWFWDGSDKGRPIADREKGALRRIEATVKARNERAEANADPEIRAAHDPLTAYHQGDPRGCALYLVPASALVGGQFAPSVRYTIDQVYSRGFAVCI